MGYLNDYADGLSGIRKGIGIEYNEAFNAGAQAMMLRNIPFQMDEAAQDGYISGFRSKARQLESGLVAPVVPVMPPAHLTMEQREKWQQGRRSGEFAAELVRPPIKITPEPTIRLHQADISRLF